MSEHVILVARVLVRQDETVPEDGALGDFEDDTVEAAMRTRRQRHLEAEAAIEAVTKERLQQLPAASRDAALARVAV